MSALNFAHPHWGPAQVPGIALTLISMHGDADAFTSQVMTFPLTEEGKTQAEMLVEAFSHIHEAVCKDLGASLESVCARLSAKVNVDADTLVDLLDELLRSSVCYDEHFAVPTAFTLSVTDQQGTRYALYPGPGNTMRRYCKLSNTADDFLEQWA